MWIAFLARGTLQTLITPVWEGFDEPFHLAYVTFVAAHGRPPGFREPSFPTEYYRLSPLLPSWFARGVLSFRAWRALDPAERTSRRVRAGSTGAGVGGRGPYAHENYERQQPPLFYYAAAPVARVLRGASLPAVLVGLRLFCVLLASLLVPLTARLARLLMPARGLFFALPIAAFAPNTLFFADRVTNDALAWPILAASAGLLVLCARRPAGSGRWYALGILVAAGVWTKMTLLPLLPAALVAALVARRRRDGRRATPLLAAVGLPAALIAPLLVWNTAASGSWSGITYGISRPHPGLGAALREWNRIDIGLVLRYWARNHLWAGGWEFLQPPEWVYGVVVPTLLLAGTAGAWSARRRGRSTPSRARWVPLAWLALFFVGAMVFHVLLASAAGRAIGRPPLAGGEGWYFDMLRAVEACAAAALLCKAVSPRRTPRVTGGLVLALLAADALGTLGLLLPHWAGLPGAGWRPAALAEAVAGARQAAPLLYPPALVAALVTVVLAACARLISLAGSGDRGPGLSAA